MLEFVVCILMVFAKMLSKTRFREHTHYSEAIHKLC
jgi:hypothetical protein